ncbi:MAG: class I SAM-dependent methyltransferase [Thaumarchaeota archaeon]|nr:class I SAM-dependent methyltransferase [Nitrososphaerota archaeon]RNJ71294.1 MAG: methyltransferase domain-containing protein [Thaumarchaeota archaeon S14]RNJ73699.1 MAG: methyltransferase domain-containing protein [Thaumarchaeota archaeon S13]RNJ75465.1 MAG: methyltransferase domain-containing protein [Thaumarchaeota archaeon S15]
MGLGDEWGGVMDALREIIPVYDRVNRAISLGTAEANRRRGLAGRLRAGDAVLDAGSGFGNMSRTALSECPQIGLTLHDALVPMLRAAGPRLCAGADRSCGVFEALPYRDGQFDVVMCGYSLRDAISLRAAVAEIHRVLRAGGRLVIVDLGKPDSAVARAGVSAYLRAVLPLVALCAGGRLGLRFAALHGTYRRWPRNSELRDILLERFARVELETGLMGGAIMVAAHK